MQLPDGRCRYVVDGESLPGELGTWCCWRTARNGSDRCRLHTSDTDRSGTRRLGALAGQETRYDGAVLRKWDDTGADGPMSFAGCTLVDADCADAALEEVDFEAAVLVNSDLSSADLTGADLSNANLRNADLSGANLRGADLSGATLTDATLTDATLCRADLSDVIGRYADFTGAVLRNADLSGAALSHASFANADVRGATATGAQLRRTDFSGGDLFDVDFTDVNCSRAVFSGADLESAAFPGANLESATLTDAVLFNAEFVGAEMFNADLTDANAQHATFEDADLEDVMLSRTELRDTDLRGARLYQAVFADTRINKDTLFGRQCVYETDPEADVGIADGTVVHRLAAAAWTYRRLERLHDANAMATAARQYHIRKNEVQRAYDRKHRNWSRYAVSTANRYLTKHGESLKHIIYSSAAIILLAGILYPFVGGISDGDTVYRLSMGDALARESVPTFLRTIYFSIITFTTIGYGNVYPLGLGSRALVGVQSLLGALLMALFVFVLGRRVAR